MRLSSIGTGGTGQALRALARKFLPFCKRGTPYTQKTGKESLSLLPLSKPYQFGIAVYQAEPVPYVEAALEKPPGGPIPTKFH